jgi:hypothetical protein
VSNRFKGLARLHILEYGKTKNPANHKIYRVLIFFDCSFVELEGVERLSNVIDIKDIKNINKLC